MRFHPHWYYPGNGRHRYYDIHRGRFGSHRFHHRPDADDNIIMTPLLDVLVFSEFFGLVRWWQLQTEKERREKSSVHGHSSFCPPAAGIAKSCQKHSGGNSKSGGKKCVARFGEEKTAKMAGKTPRAIISSPWH